ncbi:MAG: DNA-binding domain-containing protein [bacterium]|nr:DNA-binding domain-containing protein [bacterium]
MSAPELRLLQRWFAGVVEHPSTADVALAESAVDALIPEAQVARGEILAPNPRLDAAAMLQIYNGGYLARLVEALQGDYGAVAHVLGADGFQDLVARYLAEFPSRHPNLNRLGRCLPAFIARDDGLPHRAFVAELAELELACARAFDAPEFEPLAVDQFGDVAPEQWMSARFTSNPSLQLLAFEHPVDEFYQPWKEGSPVDVPEPLSSHVAVFRKDERVWRQRFTPSMHAVLSALVGGQPLGEALAAAEEGEPVAEWFQSFAADGLFVSVEFGA